MVALGILSLISSLIISRKEQHSLNHAFNLRNWNNNLIDQKGGFLWCYFIFLQNLE